MTMKKLSALILLPLLLLGLAVPAFASGEPSSEVSSEASGELTLMMMQIGSGEISDPMPFAADIRDLADEWTLDEDLGVWCLQGVSYCENPSAPQRQQMNVFVPAAYMDENGNFTEETVNGYSAQTAPIILANSIGGYAQSSPSPVSFFSKYFELGYVVASPGSRGKDTVTEDGRYVGTGCAMLVDLKAAVRYIKANDAYLPGNAERIVSVGTSAGGAMSASLGCSGNNPAYDAYLEEIGAIMTATDDIYAAMCYCPITDLDHQNIGYEWFNLESTSYASATMSPPASSDYIAGYLNEFQSALSMDLALDFLTYVNASSFTDENGTSLRLDGLREGSYYDYILKKLESSLAAYLKETYTLSEDTGELDREAINAYIAELNVDRDWVKVDYAESGLAVTMNSLADYTAVVKPRITATASFDDHGFVDPCTGLFFSEDGQTCHYDPYLSALISSGIYEGMDGYDSAWTEEYKQITSHELDLVNPITMLPGSDIAEHFRIRTGTNDFAASFVESVNLELAIQKNSDAEVDHEFAWLRPHGEAEIDSQDLYTWMESICRVDLDS